MKEYTIRIMHGQSDDPDGLGAYIDIKIMAANEYVARDLAYRLLPGADGWEVIE
jgi:hypothetical protein